MKQKAKVILLPTNKNPKKGLYLYNKRNRLESHYKNQSLYREEPKHNHLYIVSDDEIKEGDWYIDNVFKIRHSITSDKKYWSVRKNYKKIIATTDKSLKTKVLFEDNEENIKGGYYYLEDNYPIYITKKDFKNKFSLPRPSQQFIEHYVEQYNEGNIITDVLVEYENKYNLRYYTPSGGIECCEKIDNIQLKISQDNTITIYPIKDSWNREEYEQGLRLAFRAGADWKVTSINNDRYDEDYPEIDEDEWIKENL